MTAPDLSVTIVNHSACDLLHSCLWSLYSHPYTLGSMEIVVLDNASDDGSIEMVRTGFADVVLVTETERRGFGANQNRAIARATGELIFILNPDALVHEGTLDRLVLALAGDPRIAAAGGCILNDDGSMRQESLHRFETPLSPFASAVGVDRLRNRHPVGDTVTADGWPSGGACLVRRTVFDALEGFDEDFFMYAEDADLFVRIVRAGHLVAWVTEAVVTHPFPDESGVASSRREAESVRSAIRYMRKHFGDSGAFIYRIGLAFDAAVRLLVLSVPGLSRVVKHHGRASASLRRRYLARLRHVIRPGRHDGLAESAAEWNARKRATQPPAADF